MHFKTIGFSSQKNVLLKALGERQVHAYIIAGQEGIGKRSLVLEAAHHVFGDTFVPIVLAADIVEGETSVSIVAIRELKRTVSFKNTNARPHVIIIDNAHQMTEEAQNAVLKILEEPNISESKSNVIFFFITSSPTSLLQTIISRCQLLYCPSQTREEFRDLFVGESLSQAQIDFLFQFTNGRIGLAQTLVTDGKLGEIKEVVSELGSLLKKPIHERFAWAGTFFKKESKKSQKASVHDELLKKALYWLLYMRTRTDQKSRNLLIPLHQLYMDLLHTGFNTQLLLERLLVSFS